MNKEEFLSLISNVKEIKEENLEELHYLSQIHPYCQNIHILIAKKHHDVKSSSAPAKLHTAAIYSRDRAFLKRIIEDDPALEVERTRLMDFQNLYLQHGTTEEETKATQIADPEIYDEETPANQIFETDISEEETTVGNIPEPEILEEEAPENEVFEKELNEEVSSNPDDQPWEKQTSGQDIIEEEIESNRNSEPAEEEAPKNLNPEVEEKEPEVQGVLPEAVDEHTNEISEEGVKEEKDLTKDDFYAELERNMEEYKKGRQASAEKEVPKAPEIDPEPEATSFEAPSEELDLEPNQEVEPIAEPEVEHHPVYSQEQKVASQIEIIETFIKNSPSLSRFDLKFDENKEQLEDLSIPKLSIGEHLISENLAVILNKQGKEKKAIEIYEKLILKFPEKSAYFASCIEKIKNK